MQKTPHARHRFPPEIIQHVVWLYFRFPLSFRDVEDLLAERGVDVSCETVRRWALKFGQAHPRHGEAHPPQTRLPARHAGRGCPIGPGAGGGALYYMGDVKRLRVSRTLLVRIPFYRRSQERQPCAYAQKGVSRETRSG